MPPLAITILFVSDLARTALLFDHVFEWPKTVDEPVYVEYDLGACRVGLMPQAHTRHFLGEELGARTFHDGCPRAELYLRLDDVEAAQRQLEAEGIHCVSPLADRSWGDRAAYYMLPDGYVLAIAEPTA